MSNSVALDINYGDVFHLEEGALTLRVAHVDIGHCCHLTHSFGIECNAMSPLLLFL